jgi:hypothetical protein
LSQPSFGRITVATDPRITHSWMREWPFKFVVRRPLIGPDFSIVLDVCQSWVMRAGRGFVACPRFSSAWQASSVDERVLGVLAEFLACPIAALRNRPRDWSSLPRVVCCAKPFWACELDAEPVVRSDPHIFFRD